MPQKKIPRIPPETFNHLFGSPGLLAKQTGMAIGTVCMWRRRGVIPAHHVEMIERLTGVPRYVIRPDIFSAPRPKRQKEAA